MRRFKGGRGLGKGQGGPDVALTTYGFTFSSHDSSGTHRETEMDTGPERGFLWQPGCPACGLVGSVRGTGGTNHGRAP